MNLRKNSAILFNDKFKKIHLHNIVGASNLSFLALQLHTEKSLMHRSLIAFMRR